MMNKMWIVMFGLSLLLLLHGGMVESETSQPVLPLTPSEDEDYDDYTVYKLLEEALVSDFNLYKLRKTFLSDDLTVCLPVTYHLHCENEANCSSSINCSGKVPFSQSYLWTLFNTESFAGKFLLYFIENRLTSPLLGLPHHFCSFSVTNGVILYLDVKTFPCLQGKVSTEAVISKALVKITALLDVYAASNGQPTVTDSTAGGYGLRWTNSTQHSFNKQTVYSDYYIPIPLITVAILIAINGKSRVFQFFGRRLNERKANFFAFWSFQCVTAVVNILNMISIIKSDPNGPHSYIITIGTLCFVIIYEGCPVLKKRFCDNRKKTTTVTTNRELTEPISPSTSQERPTSELVLEHVAQVHSEQTEPLLNEDDNASMATAPSDHKDASTTVDINDIEVPCTNWKRCSDKKWIPEKLFIFVATVNTFLLFLFLAYTLPWLILGFYLYPIKVLVRIGFLFAAALCLMLNFTWILWHIEKLAYGCKLVTLFGLVSSVSLLAALLLLGIILWHIVYDFNSNNINPTYAELLTILPGLIIPAIAYVIHGKMNLAQILGFEKKKED